MVNATPIAIVPRNSVVNWQNGTSGESASLNAYAQQVWTALDRHGAMFTRDIEDSTGMLRPHLEEGLKALVYSGMVTADAFSPLRWLLRPEKIKARQEKRRATNLPVGRWSLVHSSMAEEDESRPSS